MKVYEQYSFKGGKEYVQSKYPEELKEIYTAIEKLDATLCLTKLSSEKTKQGKLLFSPPALNKALKTVLCKSGWTEKDDGKKGYIEPRHKFDGNRFREMDGIKNRRISLDIMYGVC